MSSRPSSGTKVSANRNGFAHVSFEATDVPPSPYWLKHMRPLLVPDNIISPVDCFEACTRYVSLAIKDSSGWRQRDLTTGENAREGKISMFTLQWTAIPLLFFSQGKAPYIGTHILHTGVLLGYAPSILTLARMGLEKKLLNSSPNFAPTKEALEKLAASSTGPYTKYRPDALTLLGSLYAELGTPAGEDRALRCFSEAEKAASAPETKAEWEWRTMAISEQCKIYVRRKQTDRAHEVLRANVYELDNPKLCYQYAMLLDPNDPKRMAMLEKAAISGNSAAAREMARMERIRAATEGLTDWERRASGVLGDEWFAIAEADLRAEKE